MKRYASHFLFLPEIGFLKQQVIEVVDGEVVHIFPLTEEIESVEWLPGVIALFSKTVCACWKKTSESSEKYSDLFQKESTVFQKSSDILELFPHKLSESLFVGSVPYLFYPFNFIEMQPVCETRHRQLP